MKKELKAYKGYRVFKEVDEYGDTYWYFLEKEFDDDESERFMSLAACHRGISDWISC